MEAKFNLSIPSDQDINDLYLAEIQDLELFRWNAFLGGDPTALEAVRAEAQSRAEVPGSNPDYAKIAKGCADDITKLATWRQANG